MIDRSRLLELEEDFGAEDLEEIINAFLEEAEDSITALGGLLSDEPSPEREAHFHFLKGCARNIGANQLGDMCERLEVSNEGFGQADFRAVRGEFQAVCDWFSDGGLRKSA